MITINWSDRLTSSREIEADTTNRVKNGSPEVGTDTNRINGSHEVRTDTKE